MTETRAYTLNGYSGTPTTATVTIQSFDRRERVRRALKGVAKFWAAAVGSVFIPVAHFLLVPSFLLFGAYSFFERLGAHQIAMAAEGTLSRLRTDADARYGWTLARAAECHLPVLPAQPTDLLEVKPGGEIQMIDREVARLIPRLEPSKLEAEQ